MVNEKQFIEDYDNIKDELKLLGNEIVEYVYKHINLLSQKKIDISLCIKTPPRLKENQSLISKAFYRKKGYQVPLVEITDKIGVRFVVLTASEIDYIKDIIESNDNWVYSNDRDYESERNLAPEIFDYQSVHYVIRRKGTNSKENPISCEVQIRTILQHSFAEISHSCIYKSPARISPKIRRELARSMAFIDTTDIIFENAKTKIDEESKPYTVLKDKYIDFCSRKNYKIVYNEILSYEIYEFLLKFVSNEEAMELVSNDFPSIPEEVIIDIMNLTEIVYFHQPFIPLLISVTIKNPKTIKAIWDNNPYLLSFLFKKLGISNTSS